MNVFKIPESLADKYHGAGIAIAATLNNQLVDICYLSDVLPDFSGEIADIPDAINDERIGPTVRHMQALGTVHIGMCSAWEFCEL